VRKVYFLIDGILLCNFKMVLKLLINYVHGFGASSPRNVFFSIYTCFCITQSKIFLWLKGGFGVLIFQFLNVLGIATTKGCIVIYLVVDFLKEELILFSKTPITTNY